VEGGRPRSGDGTLLCPAQLPDASGSLATNDVIGIKSIVAWRGVDTIKARLQAHYDAGADHVCILPLAAEGRLPNRATIEALAP